MAAILPSRPTAPIEAARDSESRRGTRRLCLLISLIVHEIVLAALAWMLIAPRGKQVEIEPISLSSSPSNLHVNPILLPMVVMPKEPAGLALFPDNQTSAATVPDAPEIPAPQIGAASSRNTPQRSQATEAVAPRIVASNIPAPSGGGLEGRRAEARAKLVAQYGGSPESEAAVERGLAWLVAHQHVDGGWRFDLSGSSCTGRCRHGGREKSTTAATALALLPLLGANHTPVEGKHQQAVARGLAYLQSRMIETSRGGDLQEGTMYGQGLAAIALCEAAAMTGDKQLRASAQSAVDFIVNAQHVGGGWRYFPGQAGDTTIIGWQWMALRSGQLSGLNVPRETIFRAGEFLDSVQADDGASYGYQGPGAQPTCTAIGLLCRMYSGWQRSDARLARGIDLLAERGPSYEDMYFNYYATQVMHHYEGTQWPAWNERLKNHLVAVQSTREHEAGSWHFGCRHTAPGGRLCETALSLMILEVYYRHLPLYGWQSVEF